MYPGKLLLSLHTVSSLLPSAFAVKLGFTTFSMEKKKDIKAKSYTCCIFSGSRTVIYFEKEILFDNLCYKIIGFLRPQMILNDSYKTTK